MGGPAARWQVPQNRGNLGRMKGWSLWTGIPFSIPVFRRVPSLPTRSKYNLGFKKYNNMYKILGKNTKKKMCL